MHVQHNQGRQMLPQEKERVEMGRRGAMLLFHTSWCESDEQAESNG